MMSNTFRKKIVVGIIILFLGASVIPIISVNADPSTLMFYPTDDTYVNESSPGTNMGSYIELQTRGQVDDNLNILIKFDLSTITSADITKATLKLYYFTYYNADPIGRLLNLHRLTSNWDENTVNWSTHPSYVAYPGITDSATVPGSFGNISWDVTEDVKDFVDGTYNNYGWVIDDTVSDSDATTVFYSKEGTGNNNLKPRLEIEATPTVVYVDDGYNSGTSGWGYDHFDSIQDGINAVLEGGTVNVYSGTYYENVVVNKTVDLIGSDKTTTIIDAGGSGDAVYISADWVNISGFTMQDSGNAGWPTRDCGIDLHSNYNTITDNIFLNNDFGIYSWNPSYNSVTDNTFTSNRWATHFYDTGNDNIVSGNIFDNNDEGSIYVWNGVNYQIFGNSVTNTSGDGIVLMDSDDNEIFENILINNNYGIRLVVDEGESESDDNLIYHNNLINNNYNAYDSGTNIWDNGYPSGGNYWDDYTGINDDCDGIGDTPYNISGGSNQDNYPFMNQDGWLNNPPTADANGPYYANVNNAITFDGSGSTDSDGSITGYRWDFDNNGTYDTSWLTSATTTHSYSAAGTYTVKLQVKDDYGVCDTDTATAVISIEGGAIPTADANGPYSGYVNYSVTFDSSGSIGGSGGTIVSWYWTFGDGDVSSLQNPTHTYTISGTYTVTLKVTNNYDETNTDTATATIIELSANQTPPVADAGGPYLGVANELITFDGSGSNDSDGSIVSYSWNFGDGATGTGISATHTYTTAGNYTVMLTVTDNDTLTHSNSTTANINVSGPPTIVIVVDASNIEPIEEENEKTIPITVYCYHQSVSNIRLEILESSNFTVTSLSPNITLNPGEQQDLLIKITAPKLEENVTSTSETILLQAVGDDSIISNTEQINIIVTEKDATPGFELILIFCAIALFLFLKRKRKF